MGSICCKYGDRTASRLGEAVTSLRRGWTVNDDPQAEGKFSQNPLGRLLGWFHAFMGRLSADV